MNLTCSIRSEIDTTIEEIVLQGWAPAFRGYSQAEGGRINDLLLRDASESVDRLLSKYERRWLTVCQAGWPEWSIAKVTVAPRIDN